MCVSPHLGFLAGFTNACLCLTVMGIGVFPQSLDCDSHIESLSVSDERQTVNSLGYTIGRSQSLASAWHVLRQPQDSD